MVVQHFLSLQNVSLSITPQLYWGRLSASQAVGEEPSLRPAETGGRNSQAAAQGAGRGAPFYGHCPLSLLGHSVWRPGSAAASGMR